MLSLVCLKESQFCEDVEFDILSRTDNSSHRTLRVTNEFCIYGNSFSNQSATNPYATEAPRLYDQQGNYRGKLNTNPYDPDSVSNPYGRYGNPYSADSLNNQFGAGNPYSPSSPTNPYGRGLRIDGR